MYVTLPRGWRKLAWAISLAVVALVGQPGWAEIKLPRLVSDHMVLQQKTEVRLWGWADPDEQLTVQFADRKASTKADPEGRWEVKICTSEAGGPYELTIAGKTSYITLRNILVGEVWVCSGQSNMAWSVAASLNSQQEIASANYPKIRLFTVARKVSEKPLEDCEGAWVECSPQMVSGFSAVAYFFGRHLHQELGVPVGLINSSWGATPAESWTSRQALESEPSLKPLLEQWDKMIADWPKLDPQYLRRYQYKLKTWQESQAQPGAKKIPPPPLPDRSANSSHRPANLYNAMIAPLTRYTIRGAIWYQGESNVTRAWQYRTLFPLLIRDWRQAWGQGDFPFGFVLLAPFDYKRDVNFTDVPPTWCSELREAQLLTLKKVPNVGMACLMDLDEITDIHPRNKQEVGRRLALWALGALYGRPIVYTGPIYESMAVEGDKIRIRFTGVGSGLVSRDGQPLREFTIAGQDQIFHPATAVIEGNTVVVSSPKVPRPVAVRFAWRDAAVVNLANQEGLPAAPFRTDSWKLETEDRLLNEEPY
ncbi:MAG: sialate O-acetylesterase [Thermoguttaceae bacterium]|nr:sialate O-acetylesterase [Thermoguttaceae bacterium]MDW8038792.1 sialate O-acetylesterase [Thermoguttaceae bacterium]